MSVQWILLACYLSPSVPRYAVTVLPLTTATAINNRGQIVGTDRSGNGVLWTDGRMTRLVTLPNLPPHVVYPEDINDKGEIVGHIDSSEAGAITVFEYRAFLWRRGKMTELHGDRDDLSVPSEGTNWIGVANAAYRINRRGDILGISGQVVLWPNRRRRVGPTGLGFDHIGHMSERLCDLNDAGQVAGTGSLRDDMTHAVLWDRGKIRDIGTLGGQSSRSRGINGNGIVVGEAQDRRGNWRPFLWKDGRILDLRTLPGCDSGSARAVNEQGDVVGACWTKSEIRATLWRDGTVLDLRTSIPKKSGCALEQAEAINDRGEIVATGKLRGLDCVVLLSPIGDTRAERLRRGLRKTIPGCETGAEGIPAPPVSYTHTPIRPNHPHSR